MTRRSAASAPAVRGRLVRPVVLKLGGELLETAADLQRTATGIGRLATRTPLVVVHGGGKEIDAALADAGIAKRQVDGLRITDEATLPVVVSVLAGAINTRLVAACVRAGARAVGLTGADSDVAVVRRAAPMASVAGPLVDLGLVGTPTGAGHAPLLTYLAKGGYVPIVACIGADRQGHLLNVNADTLAAHLAGAIDARRLIIAGGTAGVLDANGRTLPTLTAREAARLIRIGTASRGMVAKLQACRTALRAGVTGVVIANGRTAPFEMLAGATVPADCTQVTP